jgi:CheY-like chemotaxis protein
MTSLPPSDQTAGRAHAAPLVLVVDDSDKNRKLARDALRAGGLRTLEAASGSEGIARAADSRPDVILLDLGLPDMDGTVVAQKLREEPRTAHIPVVAFSARPYVAEDDQLSAAGFAGYLEKPIDVGEFPAQVRSYCRPVSA